MRLKLLFLKGSTFRLNREEQKQMNMQAMAMGIAWLNQGINVHVVVFVYGVHYCLFFQLIDVYNYNIDSSCLLEKNQKVTDQKILPTF